MAKEGLVSPAYEKPIGYLITDGFCFALLQKETNDHGQVHEESQKKTSPPEELKELRIVEAPFFLQKIDGDGDSEN